MRSKDKQRLKQVAIGLGTAVVAVGIGVYKLTRKNKDEIDSENIGEVTIEQCSEIGEEVEDTDVEQIIFEEVEKIEYVRVDDEFVSPIADAQHLETREEYEEYMRDKEGKNAEEMMEKIEEISPYAEVYMESGYEHGSNYHDGPYYIEDKNDGLGSEIAYDLYTDEYIGGDPFDLVKNHEEDGFPEYHWE